MCLKGFGINKNDYSIKEKESEYLQEIEVAKIQWKQALQQFHEVSEPEAVDFVTYYILAAEKRYMYLLKKYKEFKSSSQPNDVLASTN